MQASSLCQLAHYILHPDTDLQKGCQISERNNPWFTKEYIDKALQSIGNMLNEQDTTKWLSRIPPCKVAKKVGLILAGNIPLVGFHDVLCVLASGHHALIKLSSQDNMLLPILLQKLSDLDPSIAQQYTFVERLEKFDAVIATGSNNSSRYFEYYFGKVPHIIRKNRNSVAIISGQETPQDFQLLGNDIFDYFGLGCRNVSKIYVPKNYNFSPMLDEFQIFTDVAKHNKYLNNYEYNKSIFLVNNIPHLDTGFLLITQNKSLASAISVLHYEEYENNPLPMLETEQDKIQCLVSNIVEPSTKISCVSFGQTQQPEIWDYADGINTIDFLKSI